MTRSTLIRSPWFQSRSRPPRPRRALLFPLTVLGLCALCISLWAPAAVAQQGDTGAGIPTTAEPPATETPDSDPLALVVADRLMDALGGREAWESTRYLRFGFFGRRHHLWDKHLGRHRVEGETRDGEPYVVIHRLEDRGEGNGLAFLGGEPAPEERRRELLQTAYGAWVNDTYWLAMPYKLRDPGVTLAYEGTETLDGRLHDVVQLSFEEVGLTPGDRYWAYVDRQSGLMSRWAYHLQSMAEEEDPKAWDWVDWQRYGDVRLSPTREEVDGDRVLSLAPIEVPESVPESLFEGP